VARRRGAPTERRGSGTRLLLVLRRDGGRVAAALLELQQAAGGAGRVGGLGLVGGAHRHAHRHGKSLLQRLSSLCEK